MGSLTIDTRPRWKHVERGTVYVEIGTGYLQTKDKRLDNQPVVLYQSEADNRIWVRPTSEFMDGRFERQK